MFLSIVVTKFTRLNVQSFQCIYDIPVTQVSLCNPACDTKITAFTVSLSVDELCPFPIFCHPMSLYTAISTKPSFSLHVLFFFLHRGHFYCSSLVPQSQHSAPPLVHEPCKFYELRLVHSRWTEGG